jgi:hypothetical protein
MGINPALMVRRASAASSSRTMATGEAHPRLRPGRTDREGAKRSTAN